MTQNSRLDLLKRKNAGRRLIPTLSKRLAFALGISPADVAFRSLEESDSIRERARQSFPPRDEIEAGRWKFPFLSRPIRKVIASVPLLSDIDGDAFLILPDSETVGVLRTTIATLNLRWHGLLMAEPDGLILVDTDFSNMAVVESDAKEGSEDVVVTIAVWGPSWIRAVRNFPE